MTGAACMSALSVLKVGAGYSILAMPKSLIATCASSVFEVVGLPLKETETGCISADAIDQVLERAQNCSTLLVGPGIGTEESTIEFIVEFTQKLRDLGKPAIFDADALNCLAIKREINFPLNSIITPHPKELSRLLNIPVEEIINDRVKYARLTAEKFNVITVLKGARTLIAEPNGTLYINQTGNSALATAGTGDVLSGMIAGFSAQQLKPIDAAILGVYLHGLAGELASSELTEYATTATDIIDYIPDAIKRLL